MHAMASGSFVQQMLAWKILRWPIMSDPSTCKTVPLPVITHQSRPLYFSLIASDPNFPLLRSLLLCWQQRGINNGDAVFKEAYVFSSKIGRWRNLEARLKTPPSLSMLIISLDVTVYVNGYGCRLATLFHFSSLRFRCFGLWCWEWGRRVPGLPHWDYDTPDKSWTNITLAVAEGYQLLYIHADRVMASIWRLDEDEYGCRRRIWWHRIHMKELDGTAIGRMPWIFYAGRTCILAFHGRHQEHWAFYFFGDRCLCCLDLKDGRKHECMGNVERVLPASRRAIPLFLIPFWCCIHDPWS